MRNGNRVINLHGNGSEPKGGTKKESLQKLKKQNEQLNQQIYQLVKAEKKLYKTQNELGRQVRLTTALNRLGLDLGRLKDIEGIVKRFLDFLEREFFIETCVAWIKNTSEAAKPNCGILITKLPNSPLKLASQNSKFFSEHITSLIPLKKRVALLPTKKLAPKKTSALCQILSVNEIPQDAHFFSMPLLSEEGKLEGWIGTITVSQEDLGYHDALPGTEDLPFMESLRLQIEMSLHQTFLHNEILSLVQSLEDKVQKRTQELKTANTQLKLNLEELHRAQKQLVHAQKMQAVGNLTGGIAHDFNNKLGALTLIGRLILDKTDQNNPLRPDIEQILDIANKSATLVSQLLSFGRKQILKPKNIDLNELISILHSLVARILPETIEMEVSLSPQPLSIRVDWNQMEQALLNVVINSRDAMPNGGKLKIKTSRQKVGTNFAKSIPNLKPGDYATVEIIDTGIGMNEETKSKVFEPFFTTKEVGKGSGLGLAMVHGFITQSNGFILLKSKPKKGTCLKIFLPIFLAGPEKTEQNEQISIKKRFDQNKDIRLLVVEDDNTLRQIIEKTLSYAGYQVDVAINGREGLDRLKNAKQPFSLVLTDVVMPEINGGDFADYALKRFPDLKIVFMSGYPRDYLSNRGLSDTIQILQKPFEPETLIATIEEMLKKKTKKLGEVN